MTRKVQHECFEIALQRIRSAFPALRIEVELNLHVDAAAHVPQQEGLGFELYVYLQNADELHLSAGSHFWVEWFPCTDEKVFESFVQAVMGVISGEYRVVESCILGRAVAAQLKSPSRFGGWEKVTAWANRGCLLPLPRSHKILRSNLQSLGLKQAKIEWRRGYDEIVIRPSEVDGFVVWP